MLNYFPPEDVRARESGVSIDNQILDIQAGQMDDLELRLGREVAARYAYTCPTNIDARGLYQQVKLPAGYSLPPLGTDPIVEGLRSGVWSTLQKYDDLLPVPIRVVKDLSQDVVAVSNPVIMDVTGTGDDLAQVWDVQMASPGLVPIPNRLAFYIEGLLSTSSPLDIIVTGQKYPISPWPNENIRSHEELRTQSNGVVRTAFPWARIDSIVVRDLPSGARLRCWNIEFGLPYIPDITRPYTDPGYRDVLFPRYWQIDPKSGLLTELFLTNNFVGYSYIQSYEAPGLKSLCLEPYTWGMYSLVGNNLVYTDRREPWPDGLSGTGISVEPLYGITVSYDQSKPGPTRYALVEPVAYAGAGDSQSWRYTVAYPDGSIFILNQDGSVSPYVASQGWSTGVPGSVGIPLLQSGTYTFSIECRGSSGLTTDVYPYLNMALTPLSTLDISGIVANPREVCFDHLGRLWVWDGNFATPVSIQYDGFVVDRDHNLVFVTDSFESIRLS